MNQQGTTPPPAALMQMITGAWVSQCIGAAARLKIADHLAAGARTSAEVARLAGANERSLARLMRALASLGVLSQSEGTNYALTPIGECLRSGIPGSLRELAIAETDRGHWMTWFRFTDAVRSGKPMASEALGMMPWEYYAKNPEDAEVFSSAMGNLSAIAASELVRVFDFSKSSRIVDIGGAHGVLLSATLRANPKARGVLFDLPHVIATADGPLKAQGVRDRVDLVAGDFMKEVPAGDTLLLKHILHDWNDEQALAILKSCRKAIEPSGRLLLVEMLVPPSAERPDPAHMMDLNMLVMLGGLERTEAEFGRLLSSAGFKLTRALPTHTPFFVLEASPA